jgi:cAMP phosphodiesterase
LALVRLFASGDVFHFCLREERNAMKIRVLSSDTNPVSQLLITFVVNERLAIDAGTLAFHLKGEELLRVQDILLTHIHLDHIASLPFIFSEMFASIRTPVRIHATPTDIANLKAHVFNDIIWPDFTKIANPHGALMEFVPFAHRRPFEIAGLKCTPIPVNHTVETCGVVLEDDHACVALSSDTGLTSEFWTFLNGLERLDAVFVDVAFSNGMESVAVASKHLTAHLLTEELRKLHRKTEVYAVNLKPVCRETVMAEIAALGAAHIRVAELDVDYVW